MTDTEVFDGKEFSELLRDIHDNALDKRKSINSVIAQLVGMIKNSDDAIMLAPMLREFYDVGIKNDDQVIKVAAIAQKVISAKYPADGTGELLTEAEKDQLLSNASSDISDVKSISRTVESDLGTATLKLEKIRG